MRGTTRPLSLRRRLIADLMHAAAGVPFITLRRTLAIGPLLDARENVQGPPGWAAVFVKAFSLAARDEPALRTLYLKWPWARLYELRTSVGLVAIARRDDGEESVMFEKVADTDSLQLGEIDRRIREAKTAPAQDIPFFRRLLKITALPLPLRRLLWGFAMNNGRQRSNYAGSFAVTSVSALGDGDLHALSPGPFILSYGAVTPARTIDVVIRWDHRVADGALIARTLQKLQELLNSAIAGELRAAYPPMPARSVQKIDRTGHSA